MNLIAVELAFNWNTFVRTLFRDFPTLIFVKIFFSFELLLMLY